MFFPFKNTGFHKTVNVSLGIFSPLRDFRKPFIIKIFSLRDYYISKHNHETEVRSLEGMKVEGRADKFAIK